MKDPLQSKQTPYEILGVPVNADKKEIEKAFKGSFKGKNFREAAQARSALNKPLERAFTDLFLYNETFVKQLIPQTGSDNSKLLSGRIEIAKAWNNIQIKLFPHFASTHSLALIWYWWAIYREEEQWALLTNTPFKKEPLPVKLALGTLWSYAICHWAFLINAKGFWKEWEESKGKTLTDFDNENIKNIRRKLENHFINIFHHYSERYRIRGDNASIKRYQEYELMFSTEIKTARGLLDENLTLSKGGKKFPVCCGRMMLEKAGLLNSLRQRLEELLRRNPQNERLRKLTADLSPYVKIEVLIANKKFDEAIQAIKSLSSKNQGEEEVLRLQARVYLEKGNQNFSLNRFKDAIDCWKKGVTTGELHDDIRQAVVSHCKTKAASLQRTDPDTAIKILEEAITFITDKALNQTLSAIYLQRGIERINKAQQDVGKKPASKTKFEKGIGDIEKAVKVDPSNPRAREQLKAAKDILSTFDFMAILEDIKAKKWESAVYKLKKILKKEPQNVRAKELLSTCENQLCWFCRGRKKPPLESAAIKVKMYRVTGQIGFQIQWQSATVSVPRCKDCKNFHEKSGAAEGIGCLVGGLLGVGSCWMITEVSSFWFGLIPFVIFAGIGTGLGSALNPVKKGSPEETKNNSPVIKQMLKDGWVLGEKPPGIQ